MASCAETKGSLVFEGVEVRTTPFLHGSIDQVFNGALADDLNTELNAAENWNLHRGSFFEQYELDLLRHGSEKVRQLLSEELLGEIRRQVRELLMAELDDRIKVIAHRMVEGQGVGLHNDAPSGDDETHRLVVHFGETRGDDTGGHLALFRAPELQAIDRVIRSRHNLGVAFAASTDSYHAVTPVQGGVRHTIVFSFWAKRAAGADWIPSDVAHSGGTLRQHLEGVRDLLQLWDAPQEVRLAGLFHSAYGTEHFDSGTGGDESFRERLRATIGEEAEGLVWLYSVCARRSIVEAARGGTLRDHRDGSQLPASPKEIHSLLLIDLADTVEQLPRVPIDEPELRAELERFAPFEHELPARSLEALRQVVNSRLS